MEIPKDVIDTTRYGAFKLTQELTPLLSEIINLEHQMILKKKEYDEKRKKLLVLAEFLNKQDKRDLPWEKLLDLESFPDISLDW